VQVPAQIVVERGAGAHKPLAMLDEPAFNSQSAGASRLDMRRQHHYGTAF
jgi:hypothetical protein